jgi:cellulase/cellobiase CelA1
MRAHRILPAVAVAVAMAAALLLVGGAVAPVQAQPPTPVTSCSADYAVVNTWSTGFTAEVTVTNTGAVQISSWQVTVTVPGGAFSTGWSATYTVAGNTVIIDPAGWNAPIAPGGSTAVGFAGTGAGAPSGIGVSCQA